MIPCIKDEIEIKLKGMWTKQCFTYLNLNCISGEGCFYENCYLMVTLIRQLTIPITRLWTKESDIVYIENVFQELPVYPGRGPRAWRILKHNFQDNNR